MVFLIYEGKNIKWHIQSTVLFIERSIYAICTYSDFFLVCNLYDSGQQIMPHIPDLKPMTSVDIGDFYLLGY